MLHLARGARRVGPGRVHISGAATGADRATDGIAVPKPRATRVVRAELLQPRPPPDPALWFGPAAPTAGRRQPPRDHRHAAVAAGPSPYRPPGRVFHPGDVLHDPRPDVSTQDGRRFRSY